MKRATFSRYFTGAELNRPESGAGRLLMSEELRRRYPEDEEFAKIWAASQIASDVD